MDRTPTCKRRWEHLDDEELACVEEELLGTAEDPVWVGELDASGCKDRLIGQPIGGSGTVAIVVTRNR